MAKNKFPVLAIILLIFGIAWLINDLYFPIDLPWTPVILIVIAIGMIANRYGK